MGKHVTWKQAETHQTQSTNALNKSPPALPLTSDPAGNNPRWFGVGTPPRIDLVCLNKQICTEGTCVGNIEIDYTSDHIRNHRIFYILL